MALCPSLFGNVRGVERKQNRSRDDLMKKFYFVGGPKTGKFEEFFRRRVAERIDANYILTRRTHITVSRATVNGKSIV